MLRRLGLFSFAAFAAVASAADLTLSRGGVEVDGLRYWAVSDTFLDRSQPDTNYGRDVLLSAGPDRTVLIRFEDLARVIPAGKRVKSARLRMTIELGDSPRITEARLLAGPWGEGPGRRGDAAPVVPKGEKATGPFGSATWRSRLANVSGQNWSSFGATAPEDGSPLGLSATSESAAIVIGDLAAAVNRWRDYPWTNFGISLRFGTEVDFASSDAPKGRPSLELEFENAPADASEASIGFAEINDQREVSATVSGIGSALEIRTFAQGKEIFRGPAKAGTVTAGRVPFGENFPSAASDVYVSLWNSDRCLGSTQVFANAQLLTARSDLHLASNALAKALEYWNSTILPQSRYSFAREGVKNRFRIQRMASAPEGLSTATRLTGLQSIGQLAGLPNLPSSAPAPNGQDLPVEPFAGVMGFGDARDESGLPRGLSYASEPMLDAVIRGEAMVGTGLLSPAEVAWLNTPLEKRKPMDQSLPTTVVVRLVTPLGVPLAKTSVTIYRPSSNGAWDKGTAAETTRSGTVAIPALSAGTGPFGQSLRPLLVAVGSGADTTYGWVRPWEAMAMAARTGTSVAILTVPLDVAAGIVDRSKDIARDRSVSDSLGSTPAQLLPWLDGDTSTTAACDLKAGEWIEVDLGRDRAIGEIRLGAEGSIWQQFDIALYSTGQKIGEANLFASEQNGTWSLANRAIKSGTGRELVYRGPALRARFIRFTAREAARGSVRISGLTVFSASDGR